MYLAPLNYDRYFTKIFSDDQIARRFLEDFFDVEIQEFESLKDRHLLSNDASAVEFDFRCKIEGSYVIIDMQQWYKRDIVQRFYLYHALNTGLQLEDLPLKSLDLKSEAIRVKKTKDYRELEPVLTLIWMVVDSLNFKNDFISYLMAPEVVLDFLKNDRLWHESKIKELLEERRKILEIISNDTKSLDFLPKNRLIFAFQRNIVKNKTMKRYEKWFEFAEKTRDENNKKEDFEDYRKDEIFSEMIRRLRRDSLTDEDFEYIADEKTRWEEVLRLERGIFDDGKKEGDKVGYKRGKEEGALEKAREMAAAMKKTGLPTEQISQISGLSREEIDSL